MKTIPFFDRILLTTAVAMIAIMAVCHFLQTDRFHLVYAAEDGPAEWGTMICLFASFVVLARYALGFGCRGQKKAMWIMAFGAFLFFFASGEEISWGQRIIGWEAGDIFTDNSYREETNLHNLKIGEIKLVKVLFGNVLTVVLLCWLVGLTVMYRKAPSIARLADRWAVPVAGYRHAAIILLASVVVALVELQRKWEFYEFIFSLVALSIFLYPQNARVFRGETARTR